jgi:LPXTG-motif cell wall-anchored protein
MRKLMIPAVALGVLTLSAMGLHNPARAEGANAVQGGKVAHGWVMGGDDGDDDDGEERASTQESGGGGTASASGELPATGGDASSIALIGAVALAAGGAMYGVSTRRRASVGAAQRGAE